jgi:hypothetical protein
MPPHLPIYYDRNGHFRHDVVCSRSITPFDLRLPWAAFETSRPRDLQKTGGAVWTRQSRSTFRSGKSGTPSRR